jgi:hypothetical protein
MKKRISKVERNRNKPGRKIGTPKTGGRIAGTPNKLTASVKRAFQYAFAENGGNVWIARWAKEHESEFFRLFARLIPSDSSDPDIDEITHVTVEIVGSESGGYSRKRLSSDISEN